MKKIIATTTINSPTEAVRKYDAMPDWELLVVGDKKTPEYKLERGYYMGCDEQMDRYRDLCDLIGWNSVRRGRMIAWIEAYKRGADILASIDDDCVPMENWGKKIRVGLKSPCVGFKAEGSIAFDPLDLFGGYYWSRGFPLEEVKNQHAKVDEITQVVPLVQADLCEGQGDVDATLRISRLEEENPEVFVFFTRSEMPLYCDKFSPINTQNTFIHRSVIKDFPANIPFIGRADDIWAGYIFQALHPNSTIYCAPTAEHQQERSIQSIVDDLEDEIFLYRYTYKFLVALKEQGVHEAMKAFLPSKSIEAIDLYGSYFND